MRRIRLGNSFKFIILFLGNAAAKQSERNVPGDDKGTTIFTEQRRTSLLDNLKPKLAPASAATIVDKGERIETTTERLAENPAMDFDLWENQ